MLKIKIYNSKMYLQMTYMYFNSVKLFLPKGKIN